MALDQTALKSPPLDYRTAPRPSVAATTSRPPALLAGRLAAVGASSYVQTPGLALGPLAAHAAQAVSQVACPPLLAVAGILLCAHVIGGSSAWLWASAHSALAIVLPTLYIVWLLHRGRVSDLHLRVRSERIRPLVCSLLCGLASLAMLHVAAAPGLLVLVAGLNLVQLLLFLGITLKWKISAHTASASGLAVLGWMLLGAAGLLLGLTVPLIAWSRVYLQRHTPAQTIAGTLLGSVLWMAVLLVYGA
jgi:membrane-associated phospholipid phosphatase